MERRSSVSRVAPALATAVAALAIVAGAIAASHAESPIADGKPPATLAVGDALPSLDLRDQHDEPIAIGASTRLVLLSRDMDGGGHVKEALAEDGRLLLERRGAVYIADVSRMPGFVRSAFALPSMRKRPYPIALDETGTPTASLPSEDGKATILVLEDGRIASVAFAASGADVRGALE